MESCGKAEQNPIHKKIVDQIVAVDNFVAFKSLMCKRNRELNKQAMALLEKNEIARKEAESKPKEEVKKEETKDTATAGQDLAK